MGREGFVRLEANLEPQWQCISLQGVSHSRIAVSHLIIVKTKTTVIISLSSRLNTTQLE